MENADIAKIFEEIADLLEIKNDNPFRVRSYRNAALIIGGFPESMRSIVERDEKELENIKGIGKSIHEKIVEIVKTGKCQFHDELLKELPPGLLELLEVSGIGPKKVQLLYEKLGIQSVDELENAAKKGKLRDLPHMGEKTEEKILKAIQELKSRKGRFRLSLALAYAEPLVAYLKKIPGVIQVEPAGSLRRWKDTIGDVDILVTCKKDAPVMDRFVKYPDVKEIIAKGDTKSTAILKSGLQVDVRVLDEKSFGAALQYFTGSKAHNIAIRDRAKKMGLKISEYGVFEEKTGKKVAGENEEDVYKAVGLPWIPPELRENMGEVEAAERGKLPRLVEINDIKGDLHVHSSESDGIHTLEEMVSYAMQKKYEYIAITEHSKAVGVAHGLDDERALKQIKAIDKINIQLKGFKILKGTEVDIKADGSLDHSEEVLRQLDVVVGAIHSKFNMTVDEMTDRIIKAMSTGLINIIAHPTGRIVGVREPYPVDMPKIIEAAKKYGVMLELNSYPERLDLNDSHCRLAKEIGVMVAISTDSHNRLHLDYIRYGIHTARRGWLEKDDVLNTRPLKEVLKILKRE
ncbi:MAG: DNA polymerase III [Deltaproteobacteria bacterium GWC2_42_51]|nr:MAG: DNA polymerase III [Deltaproteobacteria bacterium GWA2_42_85]OGP31883.1 MAG: DNA polymerase III [Deltaproteobacteria bacterium GWC2_42_51]OGP43439.1 MAG: DNA polymerase III [Deltaproteobacteria bacterium GWD2_42_10]OGP46300.1 MAG: DNA polymerase III [Deltaproteobacteria bacterium GWF2_42_12]OGQ30414.1 MAG: DNA polymerase III [Deltaproteobacteria bacterium RIFCSPHIGHO2_02_FULL_42_44]OGQ35748.1 MAG: DNA polymerase III [Deltaproteobacteria bacterium RIFCSPLOWO2_02_FULL_42_39]OGQ65985.1 M